MGPDEIRAWADAVGPTALIAVFLVVVLIPMLRRDRNEGGHDELAQIKSRVEILWAEHLKGK